MTIFCIRRNYRAMDTWHEDENMVFINRQLCEMRLRYLQQKYAEDHEREYCDFTGYEVIEKNITFIEDPMYLEMIQNQEDFDYEALKNWTPEED